MSSPAEKFLLRFEKLRAPPTSGNSSSEQTPIQREKGEKGVSRALPITYAAMKAELQAKIAELAAVQESHKKTLFAVNAAAKANLEAVEAHYREQVAREQSLNASLKSALESERESALKVQQAMCEEAANYQIEIKRQIKNASDVTSSGERLASMARQSLERAKEETSNARQEVKEMKKILKLMYIFIQIRYL